VNTILITRLGFAVNMSVKQQAFVYVAVQLINLNVTLILLLYINIKLSFSDTKSTEPSQSAKDKPDITKDSMHDNTSLSSSAKEERNISFEVNASAGQNHSLSKVIFYHCALGALFLIAS
jgi:hypothetical protein